MHALLYNCLLLLFFFATRFPCYSVFLDSFSLPVLLFSRFILHFSFTLFFLFLPSFLSLSISFPSSFLAPTNDYFHRVFFLHPWPDCECRNFMVLDGTFDTSDAPVANCLASSAVDTQQMELSDYRCEEVWMSGEPIANLTFPLRDTQISHVKKLFA